MESLKYPHPSGELTIIWKPKLCIHSGECVRRLPGVYHPKDKPWIKPAHATVEELIDQINHCPSGALSFVQSNNSVND